MIKLGIGQTIETKSNEDGIKQASFLLERLGKNEVDIACLPEQFFPDTTLPILRLVFHSLQRLLNNIP